MPCLNEAETLATCITKANAWITHSGLKCEVLIADNGSTDGSQAIARSLGARVVDVPFKGYGSALFHGSVAATGDFIIMGDSDDSYDFSKLDLPRDDLGSVSSVAREQIKAEELVDFTPSDGLGDFFAKRIGVSFAGGIRALFDSRLF